MNWAARGLYRELMDECWLKGSVPSTVDGIAEMFGVDPSEIDPLLPQIIRCFKVTNGSMVSLFIEEIRTETDARRVIQANRRLGKDKHGEPRLSTVNPGEPQTTAPNQSEVEEKRREEKREKETTTTTLTGVSQPLPLEEPKKVKAPAKPKGKDFGIGALDLPQNLVDAFDRVWDGWPSKGWNYQTRTAAPRRINRELSLTRFSEIVQFNHVQKADGSRLTAEELADAALAWMGKRIRENPGAPPCIPCIGNFFSCVAGEKHQWKDSVLEFFSLEEVV